MSALEFVRSRSLPLFFFLSFLRNALCQTGYNYVLDTEYAGADFFNGWEFFTAGDPTNGFVQYVDQQTALNYGMINSSDTTPTYIGVDYLSKMLPGNNGAGRASVRISTTKVWTHGLFIGDFAHAPGGICGTWPAWWTLGPNWPYTGEIDILEGVNLLTTNAMSLHTSPNYTIAGDSNTETGILQARNCAYYQGGGNGAGCGVADTRNTSYGAGFNAIGGGVYAMQWTSDFIKVWFFPRSQIPADIINKTPNPSGWGLPAADLIGTGNNIDEHFVDHAIVFDNTFCGDYAGAPGVWNSTGNPSISCAAITGYSTCSQFVGAVPGAFKDSYWSINSVRVYQIQDLSSVPTSSSPTSPTPTFTPATSTAPLPTASASLCPTYNFTEVAYGGQTYEIECGFTLNGDDLGYPYPSYPNPATFEDCISMCNYWTTQNSTTCIGVAYVLSTKGCYPKDKSYGNQVNLGQYAARLVWAGYGDITDAPPSATTSISTPITTATTNFLTVTPVHYINPTVSQSSIVLSTASAQSSILGDGMGITLTSSYGSNLMGTSTSTSYTNAATVSISALYSTANPASSSSFSSSPVPVSSSAISSSSTIASSSIPQSISVPFSSSIAVNSSESQPSSPVSSTQARTSASMLLPSSQVPSSPLQPQSSTNPSGSLLSPILIASSTPILLPSSSVMLSPVPSPVPPSSASPSLSSSSSSPTPLISSSSSLPLTSTVVMLESSPLPGLPSFAELSSSTSIAKSTIAIVSTLILPGSTTTGVTTGTPPDNEDATTYVGFTSTSTSPPSPPSAIDEGSAYAGCLGYPVGSGAFQQVEQSSAMTVEQCLSDCFGSFYAGVSGQSCYCGDSLASTVGLIKYPDSDCNIPCPGDPAETCGGDFATEMFRRRQSITLLTTYNNTFNINAAQAPSSAISPPSTPSSPSSPTSVTTTPKPPVTAVLSSTISSFASLPGSSTAILSVNNLNISTAPSGGGIHVSAGPGGGSQFIDSGILSTTNLGGRSGSSFPNSSTQTIAVIISTVWVDVCDVCEHGMTTRTTTITSLHCGCTDTPTPTIPMITSTKACAACGEGGTPASIIVTYPDTSVIASASAAATVVLPTMASNIGGATRRTGSSAFTVTSRSANTGMPAGAGVSAALGSSVLEGSTADNEGETTPAQSGDISLTANSTAASGNFGAPLISGPCDIATINDSVMGPIQTSTPKSGNGASPVSFNLGTVPLAFIVTAILV